MQEPIKEFTEEDWRLIAQALAQWAGNPNELACGHEERAYELIETIAERGTAAHELVRMRA